MLKWLDHVFPCNGGVWFCSHRQPPQSPPPHRKSAGHVACILGPRGTLRCSSPRQITSDRACVWTQLSSLGLLFLVWRLLGVAGAAATPTRGHLGEGFPRFELCFGTHFGKLLEQKSDQVFKHSWEGPSEGIVEPRALHWAGFWTPILALLRAEWKSVT